MAIAVAGAALISAVVGLGSTLFRVKQVPKGWWAPYTMRAPVDLSWSQHDVKLEEEVRGFVPIYDAAPGLFELRKQAILAEVPQLQASYWRLPGSRQTSSEGEDDQAGADASPTSEAAGGEGHVDEVVKSIGAVFDLLEPAYRDGVIADEEFPARQQQIRVFESDALLAQEGIAVRQEGRAADSPEVERAPPPSPAVYGGRYRRARVDHLHHFSDLRPLAEMGLRAQFPDLPVPVRNQALRYVLDRLPPNLRYSRTNADRIADRSLVTGQKSILVRRGEVLVRRGQIIDTQAEAAVRAALDAQPGRKAALAACFGLLLAVTLLGSQGLAASGPTLAKPRVQAYVLLAFALMLAAGKILLAYSRFAETAVPLVVIPATIAYLAGSRSGAAVALLGATYGALGLSFDVTTFAVLLGGGLTVALLVRRERVRTGLAGAAATGLVQAAVFAACVAMGARPRSIESVFVGVQAAISGALAAAVGIWFAAALRRVTAVRRHAPRAAPAEPLEPGGPHVTISAQP